MNGGNNMSFTAVMDISASDSFLVAYNARQGESGEIIRFKIYDNGIPLDTSQAITYTVKAETPLGHFIQLQATGNSTGCMFNTNANMNAESGYFKRFYVELTFADGSKQTTPDIIYYVVPEANFAGGAGQDYIDKVQAIIDKILADYEKFISDMETEYDEALKKLLDNVNQTIKDLQDEAAEILNGFQTKLDDFNTKLNALTSKVSDIETQLATLQAKMNDLITNGAMTKAQANAAYMNIVPTPVNAQDWNTLTTMGTYSVEMATGANMPDPVARWGTLLVQGKRHNDSMLTQLFISDNAVWFRRKGGVNTWTAWKKLGDDVDTTTVYTLKDTVTSALNNVYQIGFYHLQGNALPSDIPDLSAETGEKDGYLLVYTRKSKTTVSDTIQVLNFPDLGKVFMRLQKNSVPIGEVGTTALTWYDWHQIAGAPKAATAEDIITGESDTLMVTPKGLSEATKGNTIFEEYFGAGGSLSEITTTATVPIGGTIGGSINYQQNRPYTINADNTLTFNKAGRFKFEGQLRFVPKDDATLGSDYAYTQLMVNNTGKDFISQGSSRGGTLKLTWVWSGFVIVDVQAGDTVKIQFTLRSGKQMFAITLLNLQIKEVRTPDFLPIYEQPALGDDPVIRQSDLNQLNLLSGILNLNIDTYIGTESRLQGTAVANNASTGFGATKQSLRPEDNMSVRNSNGTITINQTGTYLIMVQCWFQLGVEQNGYVYFNLFKNGARAGGQDRLFGAGANTMKHRYDGTGMYTTQLTAGDVLSVQIETGITTGFTDAGAKAITIIKLT